VRKGSALPTALILVLSLTLASVSAIKAQARVGEWSQPVVLSGDTTGGWFPDVAADNYGRAHVIWEANVKQSAASTSLGRLSIMYMYRTEDGALWTRPNDAVAPLGLPLEAIFRAALTAGNDGYMYLTYNVAGTVMERAPAEGAWSAASWSVPSQVTRQGAANYMSDVVVDQAGAVHIVWDQITPIDVPYAENTELDYNSALFYTRSKDGGRIWSQLQNLSGTPRGVVREQIKVDSSGTIFVTWDEGWDRLSQRGAPEKGVLVYSQDGGETWSEPVSFKYPENTSVQLTAASNGQGGVLAVWRATTRDAIYYAWSVDGAHSWSPPAEIPGILARNWGATLFDAYDMAVDSAGMMHLVVVGRKSLDENEPEGVYHLIWDGVSWSGPATLFSGPGSPEYPKIAIGRGNQLHVVWFTRDRATTNAKEERRQVWYSNSLSSAPTMPLPPPSTPILISTPRAHVTQSPTSTPVPASIQSEPFVLDPNSLTTENDDVLLLLASLAPAVLIVAALAIGARLRRR